MNSKSVYYMYYSFYYSHMSCHDYTLYTEVLSDDFCKGMHNQIVYRQMKFPTIQQAAGVGTTTGQSAGCTSRNNTPKQTQYKKPLTRNKNTSRVQTEKLQFCTLKALIIDTILSEASRLRTLQAWI